MFCGYSVHDNPDGRGKSLEVHDLFLIVLSFEELKTTQLYLPPLPILLLANPIHLLGIVRVVRQCLNLSLSNSANSGLSYEGFVWSKRGCEERKDNFILQGCFEKENAGSHTQDRTCGLC